MINDNTNTNTNNANTDTKISYYSSDPCNVIRNGYTVGNGREGYRHHYGCGCVHERTYCDGSMGAHSYETKNTYCDYHIAKKNKFSNEKVLALLMQDALEANKKFEQTHAHLISKKIEIDN